MKIIDLSHTIEPNMPVYPGTEPPIISRANTLEKDGFREAKITMYSHTGTHIDAPGHIIHDGMFLDNMEVEQFIGTGTILDFSNEKISLIDLERIKSYEVQISNAQFIILKTGWSQYWGDSKYFEGFPSLSEEAVKWLLEFNLKGIGVDTISIDSMDSTTLPIHKLLLLNNMIIIENLTNLDDVNNDYFTLSVLPLKTKNADGSPVRAIAIENIWK